MKRTILLLILLPFVIFCQSSKRKVQLIEDLDAKYELLQEDVVTTSLFLTGTNIENILKIFNQTFSNYWTDISRLNRIITIRYVFYINEEGKIDKIKRMDVSYQPNLPGLFYDKIEPKLLERFALIKLTSFSDNNKVKYRFAFEYHAGNGNNNKMESSFSLGLKNSDESTKSIAELNELPRLIEMPTPRVPSQKKGSLRGKTFLKVTVDEKGKVAKSLIIESAGEILDKAAMEAMKSAKFKPGIKNGKAHKMDVIIPIEFDMGK